MGWPGSTRGGPRPFYLIRAEDVSGVSGTGVVAIGVVFPSGRAVMEWCSNFKTVTVFPTVEMVARIHGHGGRTRVVFGMPAVRPRERFYPDALPCVRRRLLKIARGRRGFDDTSGATGPDRVAAPWPWWLPPPAEASSLRPPAPPVRFPPGREIRRGAAFPGGLADNLGGL